MEACSWLKSIDYWTWASPRLDRMGFSLVTKGGDDGFSCYVQGNNQIWLPPDITSGYNDRKFHSNRSGQRLPILAALSEYFVLHGIMMSPKLLLQVSETTLHWNILNLADKGT